MVIIGRSLKESVQDARDSILNLPTFFLTNMEIKGKSQQQVRSFDSSAADKQLKDVAALYEKQFLREMVKQMRSTVSESEFMPSGFAEKYYREQLDHQYVEQWGDKGGIGLGKMIYDQLLEKYGDRLGLRIPQQKALGPLPLTQRDQWTGTIQEKDRTIRFERNKVTDGKPVSLESPWEGRWLGSFQLENGLQVARLQHDGFQSLLIGKFQIGDKKIGDPLRAGESFGVLAPDTNHLLWRLEEKEQL